MHIWPLKVARFSSCCSLRQWDGSNVVSEGSRCSLRSWKVSQVHYLSVVDQNFWWAWAPPNLFPHHIGFSPYYVSMPLFADSVCFGLNPDRQGSSHQPRGCCPNERARGGYPDRSNAWGRVSWAAGPKLMFMLMTTASRAPTQVYKLLSISLIFLCYMLVCNVLVTLSDCCLMNIHVWQSLENLYRKYCRVCCSFQFSEVRNSRPGLRQSTHAASHKERNMRL
jgi:hypothetical protein